MARSSACEIPTLKRRKCAQTTRAAILEAARTMFAARGYEQTGLRDIATSAGIDAAMICRYFGSKQELLAAVLEAQSNVSDILSGPREDIGRRMAEQLFSYDGGDNEMLAEMLVVLRAASSREAAPLLSRSIEENFLAPLRARLTGAQRSERAVLIGAYLLGTAVLRFVLKTGMEPAPSDARLMDMLTLTLQAAVDAPQTSG
ncbi:MAG TPA: TetR family transcriptional regulator [Rhizomicrobium sp.]|nr:TetR family transcriptional regulator [Rhizomicrobium sp.]